jgi:arylsulfatase A-like enzyme
VNAGPAPFAGLFISAERRQTLEEWSRRVDDGEWPEIFERAGVNRVAYAAAQRDVYDEGMAHQDYQIGRLVERLKARGEWEHTLLIVAADHSVGAANQDWGILMHDTLPSAWEVSDPRTPMFRSGVSRIPLIVVWPERIAAGQRFSDPVSMIDMLPTILDLVDLPMPQVMQGQSLAPLLLGEAGWEPRPVILDEFAVDGTTGEFRGRIEVVDGRWGASLEINPDPEGPPERRRPTPLLLYDLWNDPMAVYPLNDERPELVEKYTAFLEAQFEAHMALSQLFTPSESVALTPEQLETLRALGYIQ